MPENDSYKNVIQSDIQRISPEDFEENVCDLLYLNETMGGKKPLIKDIIDAFLIQVPEELMVLNEAIFIEDYAVIKNIAHTMKSSVSIMGISILAPILHSIEEFGAMRTNIEKIRELNNTLNIICKRVILELEKEKHYFD